MKFKLHYTHNFGKYKDIEVNTLEELLKLVEEKDYEIIIGKDLEWQWRLEVYDDYRE